VASIFFISEAIWFQLYLLVVILLPKRSLETVLDYLLQVELESVIEYVVVEYVVVEFVVVESVSVLQTLA